MKLALAITALVLITLGSASAQKNAPTFDCVTKSGYFADTFRDCHVFYYCYPDGKKLTMSCPDGTTFSQSKSRCEPGSSCC